MAAFDNSVGFNTHPFNGRWRINEDFRGSQMPPGSNHVKSAVPILPSHIVQKHQRFGWKPNTMVVLRRQPERLEPADHLDLIIA
jgi:hypothetical protein